MERTPDAWATTETGAEIAREFPSSTRINPNRARPGGGVLLPLAKNILADRPSSRLTQP